MPLKIAGWSFLENQFEIIIFGCEILALTAPSYISVLKQINIGFQTDSLSNHMWI